MSSLQTHLKQPLTRKYVQTQDANNGEKGPYVFKQSDFDAWYAANPGKIQKLSKDLYIIPGTASGSTFQDVVTGSNGATELDHSVNFVIDYRKTILDLGSQITIGTPANNDLLVFRKVQVYANSSNGTGGYSGQIPVSNDASDLPNAGRFLVRVARV